MSQLCGIGHWVDIPISMCEIMFLENGKIKEVREEDLRIVDVELQKPIIIYE